MKNVLLLLLLLLLCIPIQAQERHFDVPYNNYFDNRNWEDDYIVVDANQDGNTWRKENHRIAHHTNYYPRASKTADDWFFLPGIYLEAGKPYQFCMMARICSIYDPGKVEVMVGCSPEVTGMTKEIMNPFTINTVGERQTCENRCFYVEQSDIYYFGIHNMSEPGSDVEIYEIDVEPGIVPESPMPVIEPLVQPDPIGRRVATIGIYGPRFNMAREKISEDAVIDYEIDGQLVGSSLPAEYVEFQVEVDKNDDHEFRIVPLLNGNPGPKVRVSAYVGQDIPLRPENFKVELQPDGLFFTWDYVPNIGFFGHPVIPEEVGYTVYAKDEYSMGWLGFSEDDINVHRNSFFYPWDYSAWVGTFYFQVVAQNEKGVSHQPYTGWTEVVIEPNYSQSVFDATKKEIQIFDLSGRQKSELHPGFNIIQKDGVTRKVVVKE